VTTDDRRIQQLLEAATQARASGRVQYGEQLLRTARAEAPQHPLVLNETARQLLLSGDAAAAHDILERAVAIDPSHASMWLNLAAARRTLGRIDDELAAVDRALALQPANVRALLQKGSLQELKGLAREAAVSYRTALQMIPPGAEPPPEMRPVIAHAEAMVAANNRELESFLERRLQGHRTIYRDQSLGRFDRCLDVLLQKRRLYRPRPSFMHFPYLPAIEFYERGEFPWLESLEAATDDIRAELINVLADGPTVLDPYVSHAGTPLSEKSWHEVSQSRRWGVYFLWREGVPNQEHIARCPRTVAALEAWPRWDVPGVGATAVFSILEAKTRIPAHSGVNNTRLLLHLPLIVPPGCGFRVGAEQREWVPGQALIFDDTFEHEAWNDSDVPRAVLILDIWNPRLTEAERQMLREVIAGVDEYYGFMRRPPGPGATATGLLTGV
jgi:aspartyl/asparaginyl beta-hydroxylase (cupin superfamily)